MRYCRAPQNGRRLSLPPASRSCAASYRREWLRCLSEQSRGGATPTRMMAACLQRCKAKKPSVTDESDMEEYDAELAIRKALWKNKKLLPPLGGNMPLRQAFERLMYVLMWYTGITVPLMSAFRIAYNPVQLVIDYLVDFCYWIDIAFTLRTAYYDNNHELVVDEKLIRDSYVYKRMPLDIIANIPWELFALAAGNGTKTSAFATWRLFRMLRFARLIKIHKPILVNVYQSGALQLVSFFPLMTHWTACIWWNIGYSGYLDGRIGFKEYDGGSSWLTRPSQGGYVLSSDSGLGQKYLSSAYWASSTLMKTAWIHPSTFSEKVFGLFVILLGAIMFAVILGQINQIIRRMDEATVQRRDKIGTFRQFCQHNKVPPALSKKVIGYAMAEWNVTGGVSMAGTLSQLSTALRSQVAICQRPSSEAVLSRDVSLPLASCSLDRSCPSACPQLIVQMRKDLLQGSILLNRVTMPCAKALLMRSSTQVCLKNELLVGHGQRARELFILLKGSLQLSVPAKARNNMKAGKGTGTGDSPQAARASKKMHTQFRMLEKMGSITGTWNAYDTSLQYPYECVGKAFTTLLNISSAALVATINDFHHDRHTIISLIESEHANTLQALKANPKGPRPSQHQDPSRISMSDPEYEGKKLAAAQVKEVNGALEGIGAQLADAASRMSQLKQDAALMQTLLNVVSEELGGDISTRRQYAGTSKLLDASDVKDQAEARAREKERELEAQKAKAIVSDDKAQITAKSGPSGEQHVTAAIVL